VTVAAFAAGGTLLAVMVALAWHGAVTLPPAAPPGGRSDVRTASGSGAVRNCRNRA
jgi:hypothetical protein